MKIELQNSGNSSYPTLSEDPEYGDQCTAEDFLQRLAEKSPGVCACARIGSRNLSWLPWLGSFSKSEGGLLDSYNKELSHEHIVFEDTGDNIGFGPQGVFQEDMNRYDYHFEATCYDSEKLRKAAGALADKGIGAYGFLTNNCQRFVARLREIYAAVLNPESEKLKN